MIYNINAGHGYLHIFFYLCREQIFVLFSLSLDIKKNAQKKIATPDKLR